jgi:nicotinamide-nucleotide adenylyltransferase
VRKVETAWELEAEAALKSLDSAGPPRLAFLRRAPEGIRTGPGTLLCLSASFNPLTVAHLALGEEAARIIPPDETLFLLARANVDKPVAGLPLARRLALLTRYAAGRSTLSVAAVSHGRFADKATAILPQYPPGTRLLFALGFDTLIRLFDRKYYTDMEAELSGLFAVAEILAANREPAAPAAVRAFLDRPDVRPFRSRIHPIRLPVEIAALSATTVRERMAGRESLVGLVPPEIRPFLQSTKCSEW